MNKRRELGKEEVDGDTSTTGQPWPLGIDALGTPGLPSKENSCGGFGGGDSLLCSSFKPHLGCLYHLEPSWPSSPASFLPHLRPGGLPCERSIPSLALKAKSLLALFFLSETGCFLAQPLHSSLDLNLLSRRQL